MLFQPMQSRVKRSLVDLQHVFGELADALGDAPSMHGLERYGLQDQEVKGPLDKIVRLAHRRLLSINDKKIARLLSIVNRRKAAIRHSCLALGRSLLAPIVFG